MGIGTGVFLLAVGAILSFGVQDRISGVNLVIVGYILMAAGAVALVVGLVQNRQRANTTHTVIEERDIHNHTI